jgi:hypothetical protein
MSQRIMAKSLANVNADIPYSNLHIYKFTPRMSWTRENGFWTAYMLSVCSKRDSLFRVLNTISFLKIVQFIQLTVSVRRHDSELVPHLTYLIVSEAFLNCWQNRTCWARCYRININTWKLYFNIISIIMSFIIIISNKYPALDAPARTNYILYTLVC